MGLSGIYELTEASAYLYITAPKRPPAYSTVRYWVRTGVILPEYSALFPMEQSLGVKESRKPVLLGFEDLVSLRMIVALRLAGFSLQHVRKVHLWLQEVTSYPRPFAVKDLWFSGSDIFVEMAQRILSASRHGQYAMEFVSEWLKSLRRPMAEGVDLEFARSDGVEVAVAWFPQDWVELNPAVQFGAPCIADTRIPTQSVWSMYKGGDSKEAIARDYGLSAAKVKSAIEWEQQLAEVA